ncbi:MAG: anti-sigma factor, partial [Gemmatimonadota bacterium]|nr:anti-sigma factor [Gemmatimonadota bacterium]
MTFLRLGSTHRLSVVFATVAVSVALIGCDKAVGPPDANPVDVSLTFSNLPVLDTATQGIYEAWSIGSDGSIWSAGRFNVSLDGTAQVVSLIDNPVSFMITLEPVGDKDDKPSFQKLLGGDLTGDSIVLDISRYVSSTPLEDSPGTHVLFTPSDNGALGYPSYEDAGLWMFNIVGDTIDGSFYLDYAPLTK